MAARRVFRYAGAMQDDSPFVRSHELMSADDTALVVIDMQCKLLAAIPGAPNIVWNCRRLLEGARAFGLPALGTEQYPAGLGPSVPEVVEHLGVLTAKREFSCLDSREFRDRLGSVNCFKVLVAGIEAHVCVQQTVFDLLAGGYRVYLPVDAVGSRTALDRDVAIRRMENAGCTVTTTEAALFEWCRTSARTEFKLISSLVRQPPPDPPC